MALSRRVLWSVASGSLIYSGMASALGMGEITLHSALNQPLSAEIRLIDAGNLGVEDIRVMLASPDDFQRIGVDRLAFLQDLRFVPVIDARGSRIQVYSDRPVREPYLNFVVEVTRTTSRMLREYTVLLDPLPTVPAQVAPIATVMPRPSAPVRSEASPIVPTPDLPAATAGNRHQVGPGESLWSIAGALASRNGAVGQSRLMQDILALNPEAFAGGDAGRLMVGARLVLPDYLAGAASVPAPMAEAATDEPQPQPQPLPTPTSSEPAAVDDQVATLRQQLFEELAASREENEQLRQMLADMHSQLEAVTARLAERDSAAASSDQAIAPATVLARPVESAPAMESSQPSLPATVMDHDSWWREWMLPLGGLAVVVGLGGLVYGRRRKAKPEAEPREATAVAAPRAPAPLVAHAVSEMPRQPAHASVSETDVLEAADIYLTYGRREDALDVLVRGIEKAPEQLELRLRLLGLLAESGDVESYRREAAAYREAGGHAANLDQLLTLHPAMAAAFAEVERHDVAQPLDEEFVLDLDALADFERDEQPLGQTAEVAPAKDASDSWLDDLDGTLTLGELPSLLDPTGGYQAPVLPAIEQLEPNPEHLVRLNQAVAYIQQGHIESACVILESLASEGDEAQRQQVNELLARIA